MSRFIWCEIVCASCATTTAGRFTSKTLPRREMYADAEADGWKWRHSPDDGQNDWFCRTCAGEVEAHEARAHTGGTDE